MNTSAIATTTTPMPRKMPNCLDISRSQLHDLGHGQMRFFHVRAVEIMRFEPELARVAVLFEGMEDSGPIKMLRRIENALTFDLHVPDLVLGQEAIAVREGLLEVKAVQRIPIAAQNLGIRDGEHGLQFRTIRHVARRLIFN